MRAEQLGEMIRSEDPGRVDREHLLRAHEDGLDQRAAQHHESQNHVHDADLLVIEARQPIEPQRLPPTLPAEEGDKGDGAKNDDCACASADDLADCGIVPGSHEGERARVQPAEERVPEAAVAHG